MDILLIDDERSALRDLEKVVRRAAPKAQIHQADQAEEALRLCGIHPIQVVFLDIQMPDKNGLQLAQELMGIRPDINIIMVTGYSEYVLDAMKLYVSDYIVKPARLEDVRKALAHLRYPIVKEDQGLRVQCFGDFDVFYKGEPVRFGRRKAKELLAFLVDRRGSAVSTGRVCATLWEEDDGGRTKNYFRQILSELRRTLRECDSEDLLVCSRDSYAIDPSKLECDYYRLLEKDPVAIASFRGEYMSQYSWAEHTVGTIISLQEY